MSFKVGQRVRVVGLYPGVATFMSKVLGEVGTVSMGLHTHPSDPILGQCYGVSLDRAVAELPAEGWVFAPEQLEPLDDDSRNLVSWSSMEHIWRPSLSVGAGSGK